jgi:HSP20 family molecular chaperone IbpA
MSLFRPSTTVWDSVWDWDPFLRSYDKTMSVLKREHHQNKESEYLISLCLPALSKDNFDVSVEDKRLTAKVKDVKKDSLAHSFGVREASYVWDLNFDVDNVSATYENGILNISLTKTPPKKIAVKTIAVQ